MTNLSTIEGHAEVLSGELVELENAMAYTLSDAIREGSSHTVQALGKVVGIHGEVCALSAALVAVKARHMA